MPAAVFEPVTGTLALAPTDTFVLRDVDPTVVETWTLVPGFGLEPLAGGVPAPAEADTFAPVAGALAAAPTDALAPPAVELPLVETLTLVAGGLVLAPTEALTWPAGGCVEADTCTLVDEWVAEPVTGGAEAVTGGVPAPAEADTFAPVAGALAVVPTDVLADPAVEPPVETWTLADAFGADPDPEAPADTVVPVTGADAVVVAGVTAPLTVGAPPDTAGTVLTAGAVEVGSPAAIAASAKRSGKIRPTTPPGNMTRWCRHVFRRPAPRVPERATDLVLDRKEPPVQDDGMNRLLMAPFPGTIEPPRRRGAIVEI